MDADAHRQRGKGMLPQSPVVDGRCLTPRHDRVLNQTGFTVKPVFISSIDSERKYDNDEYIRKTSVSDPVRVKNSSGSRNPDGSHSSGHLAEPDRQWSASQRDHLTSVQGR